MLDHGKADREDISDMPAPYCPVSHSQAVQKLCTVDGFDIWRCPETATDFVWPMPSDATLKKLYDREAWFEGGERGGYQDYDTQTAPSLHLIEAILGRFPAADRPRSVLDIGCGYGTHLELAADRDWKCFGVEPSLHARSIAIERHQGRMTIAERVEDLVPQPFDLVLMLEVIEHLKDPYSLFFTLFARGMIGPDTLVVVTTPNARSDEAVANPSGWAYRHPPSHLVYYSAKSLDTLLQRLMFTDIKLLGLVDRPEREAARFEDEGPSVNDDLHRSLGICVEARGSNFKEFMHERYVPGAYWKLTEYEHMPRYAFAGVLARGGRVLDFGCGTGYGSKFLAGAASSVTGLDISADAIDWARTMHRHPGLGFDCRADLGRGLEPASFDLVTCFEMIEHVNHETQIAAVASIARLLKPEGKLVISTPNPEFTAAYGDNPYHLREMTEPEFLELLQEHFSHVTLYRQWVRPNIHIGPSALPTPGDPTIEFGRLARASDDDCPVGYIAICSNRPFEPPPQFSQFDTTSDYNGQTLEAEHRLNRARFATQELSKEKERLLDEKNWLDQQLGQHRIALQEHQQAFQRAVSELRGVVEQRDQQISGLSDELAHTREWVCKQDEAKAWLADQNRALEEALDARQKLLQEAEDKISAMRSTRSWRLLQKLGLAPQL